MVFKIAVGEYPATTKDFLLPNLSEYHPDTTFTKLEIESELPSINPTIE
jgi:hypothetical protein